MTNYEKIKCMNIEELVALMCELIDCESRNPYYTARCIRRSILRKWLESEDNPVLLKESGSD